MNARSLTSSAVSIGLLTLAAPWLPPEGLQAQETFHACYVPRSGLVYRVGEPDTPEACRSDRHVAFSWTDGLPGNDHGALNGLGDDDHPHYLLASGARPLSGDLDADGNRVVGLPEASTPGEAVPFEQAVKDGDIAGGDLGGAYPDPTVTGLQGTPLDDAAPGPGDVLRFDGATGRWAPGSPAAATLPEIVFVREIGPLQSGFTVTAEAECPEGFAVITGGYRVQLSFSDPSPEPRITTNGPRTSRHWEVVAVLESPGNLVGDWGVTATALCTRTETP